MKTLIFTVGLLSAVAVGSQLLNATPQDAGMPEMEMAGPQPTQEHRLLTKDVGDWDAALTFSGPMGDMQMTGKESVSMYGPFFQVSEFAGAFMGQEFFGRATMGYDPVREKWVGTWTDSSSPWMQVMYGDYDAATKSLTLLYDGVNAELQLQPGKTVLTWTGPDTRTYDAYWLDDEGNATRHMHIDYTRARTAGRGGARTR